MHYFALVFGMLALACAAGGVKCLLEPVEGGGAMPIWPFCDAVLLFFLAVCFGVLCAVFLVL